MVNTNNVNTNTNNVNNTKRSYKMAQVCWKGLTKGLDKVGLSDVELHREGDDFSFVRNGQATKVATLKTRGEWKDSQWIEKACEIYGMGVPKEKNVKKAESEPAEVTATSNGSKLQEVKGAGSVEAVTTQRTFVTDEGDTITVVS